MKTKKMNVIVPLLIAFVMLFSLSNISLAAEEKVYKDDFRFTTYMSTKAAQEENVDLELYFPISLDTCFERTGGSVRNFLNYFYVPTTEGYFLAPTINQMKWGHLPKATLYEEVLINLYREEASGELYIALFYPGRATGYMYEVYKYDDFHFMYVNGFPGLYELNLRVKELVMYEYLY